MKQQKLTIVTNKKNSKMPSTKAKEDSQTFEIPKPDYIHVRVRRSQATNSHNLTERTNFHSSSTNASSRRRTNPTATPTRTSPGMMAAILKISTTALQVAANAPPPPPPLFLPLGLVRELTIFANHCSLVRGRPNVLILVLLWVDLAGRPTTAAAASTVGMVADDEAAID
ncbi:basic helix-loop-helix (bHLH) DNA-bindingsuperfamily protein, partial [Striga asiatica]